MNRSKTNIDTGRLLRDFFHKNKVTNTDLGKDINRTPRSIFKYRENISIQTGILLEICHATKHNFFQDIADMLPIDFSAANNKGSENAQLIEQLQEENKRLKMENEILLRLKG